MMKLRQSLRNLGKRGLLLNLLVIVTLFSGCSSSTSPTYDRVNIEKSVEDIALSEYQIHVKATLTGRTLWIYMPVEELLDKREKPEKYKEYFEIQDATADFQEATLKVEYAIKSIPETEKIQEYTYHKDTAEKIRKMWRVLRRVIFSMERSKDHGPQFFCLVTADIKNGFVVKQLFFHLDLKKLMYELISWTEYQHRIVEDAKISKEVIGDTTGASIPYRDITMKEFIALQIQNRIEAKFQKSEPGKNADIDKEVLKILTSTVKNYNFNDFSEVELFNTLTQNRVLLNRLALWDRTTEKKL